MMLSITLHPESAHVLALLGKLGDLKFASTATSCLIGRPTS
jgi:hypothetical protein